MNKDTSKLIEELGVSPDFKTFYNENKDYMISENLSELLNKLIKKYNLKKSQIIRAAEISEVYGYQIFSGIRVPEKKKLLCLALHYKGLNFPKN